MMAASAASIFKTKTHTEIDGFPRKLVKEAFNTLLNANTMMAAYRAIMESLERRRRRPRSRGSGAHRGN